MYRQGGIEAFFKPRKVRYDGTVLTTGVIVKAQSMLDEQYSRADIADKLGVKYDTLRKAINDGRLKESKPEQRRTSKSSRSSVDTKAADGLGTA